MTHPLVIKVVDQFIHDSPDLIDELVHYAIKKNCEMDEGGDVPCLLVEYICIEYIGEDAMGLEAGPSSLKEYVNLLCKEEGKK